MTTIQEQQLEAIRDDAFFLVKFTKQGMYPQEGTSEFFEFCDLLNKLEDSLRNAGYETRYETRNERV